MSNYFDQFDEQPAAQANYFDQFDGPDPAPAAPTTTPTAERFGEGFADAFVGATQLAARGVDAASSLLPEGYQTGLAAKVDAADAKRNTGYVPPEGFDWARMAGNIANPATLLGPGKGSVLKQVLAHTVLAPAFTPTQATSDEDYWRQKRNQAALGGVIGGGAGLAGKTITGMAPMTPEAQALVARGVEPSLGQAGGFTGRVIEGAAKALPLASAVAGKSQRRGLDTYGVAAVNEAIAPLGAKVDGPTAREAITKAHEEVSRVYDEALNLVPSVSSAKVHDDMLQGLVMSEGSINLGLSQQHLRPAADQVLGWLGRINELEREGVAVVDGAALKKMDSVIGQQARRFSKSTDPEQAAKGDAWYEVQRIFREHVLHPEVENAAGVAARNAGKSAGEVMATAAAASARLKAADNSYRALLPLSKALGVGETLHPHRLRTALQATEVDRLAPMVDEGLGVLPRTAPQESLLGTTGGGMAAAGAALMSPKLLLTVPAVAAANSRVGTKVLTGQYPIQDNAYTRAIANALRRGVPSAARTPSDKDRQR